MINNITLNSLAKFRKQFVYNVEFGDTLNSLSDKFHTTVDLLVVINGLSREVEIGELILIEKIDGEEYFVKPMDTLEKIANYNKEKQREIALKNKIDEVYVGQKIYV